MNDPLSESVGAAHEELLAQVEAASTAGREHAKRHVVVERTDAVLIHACRHLAAVCEAILPTAQVRLVDGSARVAAYVVQARRVERAAAQTKRRLYGESHAVHLPWADVWSTLELEIRALHVLEREMVDDLSAVLTLTERERCATHLGAVEATSPTRPHANSPHTGRFARASRQILARADRFWDVAEGRIVWVSPAVIEEPEATPLAS